MLRVLTLSTLFPDSTRPNFGIFVERQTLGLAAQPDVEVRVVAPFGMPPWPLTSLAHYREQAAIPHRELWKGLPVERPRFTVYPGTQGRFHARSLTRALFPVLDDMRLAFPFDVIDASFFFPDGPAAVALGRRFGVPVSIKARGADIHFWGRQPATAGQVREAGRAADGLLAVSTSMQSDMAAIGLAAERIRVHHTGVDLARFAPVERATVKGRLGIPGPLVVSVGALIDRKGHEIVVEAVARLPGVSLLIAGEGPSRSSIEAAVARNGVADRVRLMGAVPHGDLPGLIAAADVMALASSSEGLANAWVEALACGTPIVITPAGGAAEVVTGDAAGRIVPREAAAFADAIADLLIDPPAPEATRRHALAFTWDANAEALRDHLQVLVAKGS
ncbi:glycosyltransferase [Sphingomonas sp. IC4-52]|uniref:glycosyltransferase n=1 Tax=Sphingomonas sp. IC4-52 TaxID=2887202 RepID=UPI001D0FA631|nr:glycosyltransferase [Sphingomonas sp. IC4-52]MCC2979341.1 glycosyltransferase [Sphingomonas sp. IC4-52]